MFEPSEIQEFRSLLERAGDAILSVRASGALDQQAKEDSSPVTEADRAANRVITEGLAQLSSHPVVSEESAYSPDLLESRFWLVDPLDGTRDFVAGLDTFVICLALIENRKPVFGMIHSPVLGQTWWALQGSGAFRADARAARQSGVADACAGSGLGAGSGAGAAPIGFGAAASAQPISNRSTRNGLIALGSRSHGSSRMKEFLDRAGVASLERLGSALKFCRIAQGDADLYIRFGPTYEWDTAAGQIILEESGCRLLDLQTGEPMVYGKESVLNGGFVASRADVDVMQLVREAQAKR